jgi:hypothetical protein
MSYSDDVSIKDDFEINEIKQEEFTNIIPVEQPIIEPVEPVENPEYLNVKVLFPNSATPIDCVSAATNCREKIYRLRQLLYSYI